MIPTNASVPLNEEQTAAVQSCCDMQQRIVTVTGPAGTGKTTVIRKVYQELLDAERYSIVLAAPTGKAAKRISEVTGIPAMTIHRLLEYGQPRTVVDPETKEMIELPSGPGRTKDRRLHYDIVIVDEYTMVGDELHRNLVNAMKPGAVLRAFGDLDQLPPVDIGWEVDRRFTRVSPFKTMMTSFPKQCNVLTQIYRQADGSGIIGEAHRIREGRIPVARDDFKIYYTIDVLERLRKLLTELDQEGIRFCDNDHQIIIPTKKTAYGTYAVNQLLQRKYNPDASAHGAIMTRPEKERKNRLRVGVGDKIVWTKNTYDLRHYYDRYDERGFYIPPLPHEMAFNGETGIIMDLVDSTEDGYMNIDFGDRVVFVPFLVYDKLPKGQMGYVDMRERVDLAYALTTHKSQGSEWKRILIVLAQPMRYTMNRKNLYTAVTRAREHVDIIADRVAMKLSVNKKGDD